MPDFLRSYSVHITIILCLTLLVLLTGFSSYPKNEVTLRSATGETVMYRVEIADDKQEHAKGLMYRREMDKDHGMLFVFEPPEPQTFWMKNTYIPLDIMFMDSHGEILCLKKHAVPQDKSLIECNQDVRAVLEVNAGQADLYGFRVGDRVHSSYFSK